MNPKSLLLKSYDVKGFLTRRKLQHRLPVKLPDLERTPDGNWTFTSKQGPRRGVSVGELIEKYCPFGTAGTTLFGKETFSMCDYGRGRGIFVRYEADGSHVEREVSSELRRKVPRQWKKYSSNQMTREVSRVELLVIGISLQRVQDVPAKGILAEGCIERSHQDSCWGECPVAAFNGQVYPDLKSLWLAEWDSVWESRGYGSSTNPWVFAASLGVTIVDV